MSKLIKTNIEYGQWIQNLKDRYRQAQIKAAARVNRELIQFYWLVGHDIVAHDAENKYGSGFFKFFSEDLRHALPNAGGFSVQNLYYMKNFYLFYNQLFENLQQPVGDSDTTTKLKTDIDFIFSVPWGHHCTIIDKYFDKNDISAALFYLRKTIEDGWSRSILKTFIETNLHLRQGKAITSFSRILPIPKATSHKKSHETHISLISQK